MPFSSEPAKSCAPLRRGEWAVTREGLMCQIHDCLRHEYHGGRVYEVNLQEQSTGGLSLVLSGFRFAVAEDDLLPVDPRLENGIEVAFAQYLAWVTPSASEGPLPRSRL